MGCKLRSVRSAAGPCGMTLVLYRARIVSTDLVLGRIALLFEGGKEATAEVQGEESIRLLAQLAVGQEIVLACENDASGHCVVAKSIVRWDRSSPGA